MGFLSRLFSWRKSRRLHEAAPCAEMRRGPRQLRFDLLEDRRAMALDVLNVGTTFLEEDAGSDLHPDTFELTFNGGAPGTQLTRVEINGDQNTPGLSVGDMIFDTVLGGLGTDEAHAFSIVSATGIDSVKATVVDGTSLLILEFTGFDPGEKLVFKIDVDEVQHLDTGATTEEINEGLDPVASGAEFHGSQFTATFTAPDFYDASGTGKFVNKYDPQLVGKNLNLPADDLDGHRDRSDGVAFSVPQEPILACISGYVYHDRNNNGLREEGEEGIAGVPIRVVPKSTLLPQDEVLVYTDENGFYQACGIMPGTYDVIEVSQPAPFYDGLDTPGTVNGETRGTVVNPGDQLFSAVLHGGDHGLEYNFGEILLAEIHGYVGLSGKDGDCFSEVEYAQPIANVVIELLDAQGQVIGTTTTNAAGEYAFLNLLPGTYSVREYTPDGLIDGGEKAGTVNGVTVGHVGGNDFVTQITLGAGDVGVHYDFCEKPPACLSGHVYHDANNNGIREEGEAPIAGVTLSLRDGNGVIVASTITDADGYYQFCGIPADDYCVLETQPDGWLDGLDAAGTIDGVVSGTAANPGDVICGIHLLWGEKSINNDFGELLPSSIRGQVTADPACDCGCDDDEDESTFPPIAGVVIELRDAQGIVVATTTTDAQGMYEFTGLGPGSYTVKEYQPAGYFQGDHQAGSGGGDDSQEDLISSIVITSGNHFVEYNFTEIPPASIGGMVHLDPDQDGIYDEGDSPLAGVVIQLLDQDGNVVATTSTNAEGKYEFTNLQPGTYGVRELQPAGYFHEGQSLGTGSGTIAADDLMTEIHVCGGDNLLEYNFFEIPPAGLTGYVFQDGPAFITEDGLPPADYYFQRDGQLTPDDKRLAGVVLELRDGISGTPLTAEQVGLPGAYPPGVIRTTTDASGYYQFLNLRPGNYSVYEVQPENYYDSLDTAGTQFGFVFNPGRVSAPPIVLAALGANNPRGDAIVRIDIPAGVISNFNNFSEVVAERSLIPPPPPNPPLLPPPPPVAPPALSTPFIPVVWLPPAPPLPESPPISRSLDYTWHLSVVNGGLPRAELKDGRPQSTVWISQVGLDSQSWLNIDLRGGEWVIPRKYNTDGSIAETETIRFGTPNAIPVPGDFNGDGVSELAVYVDGQWYVDLNANGQWDENDLWARLGTKADLPVVGDWDGDGKTDIGIFGPAWPRDPRHIANEHGIPDPANVHRRKPKNPPPTPEEATLGERVLKRSSQGVPRADLIDHVFHYGTAGDIPLAGDWNGDGIRTIAIFREGHWNLDTDGDGRWSAADRYCEFGQAGDLPVVGDFDGDGVEEIGVFRNGTWIIDSNHNGRIDAADRVFELGGAGDRPVVGDWNGDGIDEPGVYRAVGPAGNIQARVPTDLPK